MNQMRKKPFSIISKGELTSPIMAHVPHSSTFIPQDVRYSLLLSDEDLRKELTLMTDRYTPDLFACIAALGGVALVYNYSRLVVDPERFESDEDEVMSSRGMGAIYTRTADQQILREDRSATEKEDMLSTYSRPYHEAVREEVQGMLARFDRCLIIDCHSFPSKPLPYELDQSRDRPGICIGTDSFHTPNGLINLLRSFCDAHGIKAAINKPFAGTYVPLTYLGKDERVSAIMVEVNRSLYMDEETGARSRRFSQTKEMIDDLVKKVFGFEAALDNE
ncbi:MAG: N-formylglutamate amidohydrolase [Halobacteriota archaeon]